MTGRSAALQLIVALSFCQVALAQQTGTFAPTGNMTTARVGHTATLLPNGKVLIAGGTAQGSAPALIFSSAELYDPSTGSFSATGNMTTARAYQSATLLPDGKVLIAGGWGTVAAAPSFTIPQQEHSPRPETWLRPMAARRPFCLMMVRS